MVRGEDFACGTPWPGAPSRCLCCGEIGARSRPCFVVVDPTGGLKSPGPAQGEGFGRSCGRRVEGDGIALSCFVGMAGHYTGLLIANAPAGRD